MIFSTVFASEGLHAARYAMLEEEREIVALL